MCTLNRAQGYFEGWETLELTWWFWSEPEKEHQQYEQNHAGGGGINDNFAGKFSAVHCAHNAMRAREVLVDSAQVFARTRQDIALCIEICENLRAHGLGIGRDALAFLDSLTHALQLLCLSKKFLSLVALA